MNIQIEWCGWVTDCREGIGADLGQSSCGEESARNNKYL